MLRLLVILVALLFALPMAQASAANGAVESYRAGGKEVKKPAGKAQGKEEKEEEESPIAKVDCSSNDPEVRQGCLREIAAMTQFLRSNENEALNWLKQKVDRNPNQLRETMAYCTENTEAPEGQVPSYSDIHRCARKRLGP